MKRRSVGTAVTHDLLQWGLPRLLGAGYGLFSKKAANPHWPEFVITAFVLRKYREKNSFWFMVKHAVRGMRSHTVVGGKVKEILAHMVGARPRDFYRLSGIYDGLLAEKGAAVATAAIIEIVRTNNEKRKGRLSLWNIRSKKTATKEFASLRQPKSTKARRRSKPKATTRR